MYEIEYKDIRKSKKYDEAISKVLEKCFEVENIPNEKMIVSVILTNSENIREYNREYRNIDKATDVLSFPMFEKTEIDEMIKNKSFEHIDVLGDMIISIEQVKEQAEEYGHSFERELSYMVVHSFYHLMGYDHIKKEDKVLMRPKEEYVLNLLGITREE